MKRRKKNRAVADGVGKFTRGFFVFVVSKVKRFDHVHALREAPSEEEIKVGQIILQ